jgi:hypothetical protein
MLSASYSILAAVDFRLGGFIPRPDLIVSKHILLPAYVAALAAAAPYFSKKCAMVMMPL